MKKFVSLLLSLSILFSLSACAVNVGDQSKPTTTTYFLEDPVPSGDYPLVRFSSFEEVNEFKKTLAYGESDAEEYLRLSCPNVTDVVIDKQGAAQWFATYNNFEVFHLSESSGYEMGFMKFRYEDNPQPTSVPRYIEVVYYEKTPKIEGSTREMVEITYYVGKEFPFTDFDGGPVLTTLEIAGQKVPMYGVTPIGTRVYGRLQTSGASVAIGFSDKEMIYEEWEKYISKVKFGDLIDSHSSTPTK